MYQEMTTKQLRPIAIELGITGGSKMRKADLIKAIESKQKEREQEDAGRFSDDDVQQIGNGPLAHAAQFIIALNLRNEGRKGPSRKFRKELRRAGYPAHASVDIRKVSEYVNQIPEKQAA